MKGLNHVCKVTLLTTFTGRDTLRKPESVLTLSQKERQKNLRLALHAVFFYY